MALGHLHPMVPVLISIAHHAMVHQHHRIQRPVVPRTVGVYRQRGVGVLGVGVDDLRAANGETHGPASLSKLDEGV